MNKITFKAFCAEFDIPHPTFEFQFQTTRKWRLDIAWPALKVALEVEGGVWVKGRHTRGKGFINDMEKYNTAQAMGWIVIRRIPSDLLKEKTAVFIHAAIQTQIARIQS